MTQVSYSKSGSNRPVQVDDSNPFPVYVPEGFEPRRVALSQSIRVVPVISASSAYAAGDAVGGLLQFNDAARVHVLSGVVNGVLIEDLDKEVTASLSLALFDRAFTPTADNAAFDISDAELKFLIAIIDLSTADFTAFNDSAAASLYGLNIPYVLPTPTLYGQLFLNAGTPTYTTTSDIAVRLLLRVD